jgi:hypothetical protein
MREQKTIVDGVEFGTIFQFQRIFGAISSSMHPARLFVAFGMVLVLLASGSIWDSVSNVDATTLDGSIAQADLDQAREFAIAQAATSLDHFAPEGSDSWSVVEAQTYLLEAWEEYVFEGDVTVKERLEFELVYLELEKVRIRGPFEASATYVAKHWNAIVDAGIHADAVSMWQGVVAIVWELPKLLWKGGYHSFISLYGFLLLYVLCIGGGAIARMQVCWHSRAERLAMGEAIDFSLSRWRQLLTAVCAPLMFVAAITIFLLLMGLVLLSIPWLNFIGGLLYGAALLLGFLIAIIAVAYAACFPMLIPAVVTEGCGGEEAIQRSFAYLFSSVIRYLGYLIVLVISLVLGYLVIRLLAHLTLDITANLVSAGTLNNSLSGAGVAEHNAIPTVGLAWYESGAGFLVRLWEIIVRDLMIGWVLSGFFSTSAMLYLLMRKACDGQNTRTIWSSGIIQGTNVPEQYDSSD